MISFRQRAKGKGGRFSMMKQAVFLLFLCVSVLSIAGDQNWMENTVTLKQRNGYSLQLVSEIKYRSWDWDKGVFKKNWVIGIGKKLNHGFSISLNYKQELTRKSDGNDIVERRPFVDFGWKTLLNRNLAFDFRLRAEANRYIRKSKKDHESFRFRFRLKGRADLLGIPLEPYIAIEPFYNTISNSFRRYRFYAGSMVRLNSHIKFRIGFIREDNRGKAPDNVFNTGISLCF